MPPKVYDRRLYKQNGKYRRHERYNDEGTESLYGIVYDIRCPPSAPGAADYNPSHLLPNGHTCKGWAKSTYYTKTAATLKRLGFNNAQYSMAAGYCTEAYAIHVAYTLHLRRNMSWLPYCLRRMHVVKLVTRQSIFIPVDEESDEESDLGEESDSSDDGGDDDGTYDAAGDDEDGDDNTNAVKTAKSKKTTETTNKKKSGKKTADDTTDDNDSGVGQITTNLKNTKVAEHEQR